ncbi:MAG TPA: helix-turn-helix domain-containing protein [Gemmatimonadales bacterium]|nr:helix-turn-helix domain-containing protein [Gemmatimonadales bacterium]
MANARRISRRYSSPERQDQRNRTQLAILKAAEEVFRERGYGAATMQAVADSAGVSLPTVYLYFGTKPALVRSLADLVASSADLSVGHALAETEPVRMLEVGAGLLRRLHQRSEMLADVLRTGARTDPALSKVWRTWQDRHLAAVGAVARSLHARKALRDGVDTRTASDVLYTIGGPETFRQLVYERGWTPSRYERWLVEAGRRLLLR